MLRILASMILLLASSAVAQSDLYLPLFPGTTWEWVRDDGVIENNIVGGTEMIFGHTTTVITFEDSPENEGLRQFWTTAADGSVFLHGFNRDGGGRIYEPPVLYLEAPLAVGETWSQTVQSFTYPEGDPLGTFDISFQVNEEGDVTVPAGEFHAFGIGFSTAGPPIGPPDLTPTGLTRTAPGIETIEWWSEFTGKIQYQLTSLYLLRSFEIPGTPTIERTWGDIKQLHHE